MASLLDHATWSVRLYSSGWRPGSGGAGANVEAFTDMQWITMRRTPLAYPF
jgi:hypothetical protein